MPRSREQLTHTNIHNHIKMFHVIFGMWQKSRIMHEKIQNKKIQSTLRARYALLSFSICPNIVSITEIVYVYICMLCMLHIWYCTPCIMYSISAENRWKPRRCEKWARFSSIFFFLRVFPFVSLDSNNVPLVIWTNQTFLQFLCRRSNNGRKDTHAGKKFPWNDNIKAGRYAYYGGISFFFFISFLPFAEIKKCSNAHCGNLTVSICARQCSANETKAGEMRFRVFFLRHLLETILGNAWGNLSCYIIFGRGEGVAQD